MVRSGAVLANPPVNGKKMKELKATVCGLVLTLGMVNLVSCSSDETGPTDPPPVGEPAAVADLAVAGGSAGSIDLSWTSPQLLSKAGIAYELRYTPYTLVDSPPESWTTAPAPSSDQESDLEHQHTITGLAVGQVYVFALRASTNPDVWSDFSNLVVATAAEQWDTTAPAPVDDLQFWSTETTSLTVTWSRCGNDGSIGQATGYEVRYATTAFDESGWDQATPATGQIVPNANPDRLQTTITGLQEGQSYHIGARARDEAGNVSTLAGTLVLATGQARTWYVTVDGMGDAPTIEAAINQAGPGDVILVGPGRFTWSNQGTGDFYGLILIARDHTGFTLRSDAGPAATILDAEGQGGVIHIQGYNDIIIDGFTITGGSVEGDPEQDEPYAGGGIACHLASPLIRNCIITGNTAIEGGGLWLGSTGEPRLENCRIENNTAFLGGGIMLINDALPILISGCTFAGNHAWVAGGAVMAYNTFFTLEDCFIIRNSAGNKGGAISVTNLHDGCLLKGCTIIDNEAELGSAIRIYGNTILTVESSIIAFNREGPAFSEELSGGLIMGCSDVFGHPQGDNFPSDFTDAGGNFALDPLFCSLETGTLQGASPCAPGNHPQDQDCGLIGALPVACGQLSR